MAVALVSRQLVIDSYRLENVCVQLEVHVIYQDTVHSWLHGTRQIKWVRCPSWKKPWLVDHGIWIHADSELSILNYMIHHVLLQVLGR